MPRPLRFYGESHSLAFYSDSTEICARLGFGDWHRQFDLLVVARTKKDAVSAIGTVGGSSRERDLSISTGIGAQALRQVGLEAEEGAVFLCYSGRGRVLRVLAPQQYRVVGSLDWDRQARGLIFNGA